MRSLTLILDFLRRSGGLLNLFRASLVVVRTRGAMAFVRMVGTVTRRTFGGAETPGGDFQTWFYKYGDYVSKKASAPKPSDPPLVSIIMPVYNPQLVHLKTAIESVRNQTYDNWELCIVDDHSGGAEVGSLLENMARSDYRIRVKIRSENGNISAASNDGIFMANGAFLTFLDHDDELLPWALESLVRNIELHPHAKMFYSDEATVDSESKVQRGHLKGGLNRTLAWSYNYFCHLTAYRKSFLDEIGHFTLGLEGAQDFELALRAIEVLEDNQVVHIPEVLYLWRAGKESTAKSIANKPYALNAGIRAVAGHLSRIGVKGSATQSECIPTAIRVKIDVVEQQNMVSVIIPTKDNLAKLSACIHSLTNNTNYTNFEVLIVDNGSRSQPTLDYLAKLGELPKFTVLRVDNPFNYSNLNNEAAKIAAGRHLLLLNDDTQALDKDWMREMVSFSQLSFVGAVGAKLLYPDSRVQHAGVILGLGEVAGHAHRLLDGNDPGYEGRAMLHQEFMAVTGACLMVEKDVFWRVSGLDEKLAVSLNDVDFCLRLHQLGLRNIFTPYAKLIHHESVSRGSDSSPANISRAWAEIEFMKKRWGTLLQNDPYFSINFSTVSHVYNFAKPPRV